MSERDQRVAITGGIACGKSLVAEFLNGLGVRTLDADDVVHELLPDPLERKRLAAEVFNDAGKRRELEARLHPLVKARIAEWLAATPGMKAVIVPLLFETGWDAEYDVICTIASDRETQIRRMIETRGYSREEAEARIAAQMPVAEKAARSDFTVNNNGSEEELKQSTERFVTWLKNKTCSLER